MNMRKIISAAVVILSILSCSKSDDNPPGEQSLSGFWGGAYGRGTNAPNLPYMILFRDNGSMRVYAGELDTVLASKAEGSYTLQGSQLTTRYTYISGAFSGTYSARATLDAAQRYMTGTYGNGSSTEGGGTFTLTRP
jgi:hypothetical protein